MATTGQQACNISADEPVGTTSTEALACNSHTFDIVVNSEEEETTNRVGNTLLTLRGKLGSLGYAAPVSYAAGISFATHENLSTISRPDDTTPTDSIQYAPHPNQLPFTTTGNWTIDSGKFFVVQGITSREIIDNLSLPHVFGSITDMVNSTIDFPTNKPLQVFDEGTELYSNYVTTSTVTSLPLNRGLYAFSLDTSFDPSLTTAQAINNNKFDKSAPLGNELQVFAHRGFAEQFPQNTLVACSGAINVGAAGLELDAAVSSDGVTYLFHDETVDALTDGTGTFTGLASTYIDTLKFTSTVGTILADEKIPRLIDVLNLCRKNGIYIMLELKLVDSLTDVDLIIADIVASGMEHLVSLQSGNLTNVQYVRSVNSTLNVGYITAESTFQTYIDILAGLGNATVNIQHDVAFANPGMVNYARERGIDMVAYTLPDNIFTKRIQGIGIYKVIADRLVGEIHG